MSDMLERLDFQNLEAAYKKEGKGNVRLTKSTLILVQPIAPNKTTYNFPVLENEAAPIPEEIRLNINDEFVVRQAGIYLLGTIADAAGVPKLAKIFLTYAPWEFDELQVGNQNLYNGYMTIAVNKITYIDKWDIKKHEERNQTQIKTFSAGIPNATWSQDQFKTSGMVDMTPNVVLSGAKKNDVALVLPTALTLAPAVIFQPPKGTATPGNVSFSITQIAIVYRGFLAQNASQFQK